MERNQKLSKKVFEKKEFQTENKAKVTRLFYTKYFLIFVGCIMFLANLDALYPSIMEARNFVSAREILANNDWYHTTLNGLPRYEKPPLPTWITAIFGYFFGTGNLAALRFPNALLTIITGVYVYKIVIYFFEHKKTAFFAGFIFYTAYLIWYVGRSNVWDVYCYDFMWIAIFYFVRANDKQSFRNWLLFSIFVGASLLSKGPMGVIVLFLPFFIGYWAFYNRAFLKKLNYFKAFLSLIIIIFIGFSWYYYIYHCDYENFMRIFDKEVNARVNRNVQPWHRYLSFPVQMGIWVIPAILSLFLWKLKRKSNLNKNYYIFLMMSLMGVFLLSLVPEKKERYLFPIMFSLSVLSGLLIHFWHQEFQQRNILKITRKIFYYLVALISLTLAIAVPFYLKEFSMGLVLFCLGGMYITISLLRSNYNGQADKSFRTTVFLPLLIVVFLLPLILPKIYSNSDYKNVREVRSQHPHLPLYSYESYVPEVWFEYQEFIPDFNKESIQNGAIQDSLFLLLKTESTPDDIQEINNFKILEKIPYDENLEPATMRNYSDRKHGIIYLIQQY